MTRQIVLDTETTGLSTIDNHRIIEIGCVELKNRKLTGRKFHTYIHPEREIDAGASAISGLTLAFLEDKPKFMDIVDDFLAFIEDSELIIHNAPFDVGFINHELKLARHAWGQLESKVSVFDTLALARKLHPGQRNSLDALCKRYNVENSHRTLHGALLDANLLVKVYLAMTAGQTQFSIAGEVTTQTSQVLKSQKIKRITSVPLKVIYATEEECRLHDARMHAIQQEK